MAGRYSSSQRGLEQRCIRISRRLTRDEFERFGLGELGATRFYVDRAQSNGVAPNPQVEPIRQMPQLG